MEKNHGAKLTTWLTATSYFLHSAIMPATWYIFSSLFVAPAHLFLIFAMKCRNTKQGKQLHCYNPGSWIYLLHKSLAAWKSWFCCVFSWNVVSSLNTTFLQENLSFLKVCKHRTDCRLLLTNCSMKLLDGKTDFIFYICIELAMVCPVPAVALACMLQPVGGSCRNFLWVREHLFPCLGLGTSIHCPNGSIRLELCWWFCWFSGPEKADLDQEKE